MICAVQRWFGIFKALALLRPNINVVGIIPSTENLSGGKAYKPGDVLTAYNGKTMEIFNTDAEGRLYCLMDYLMLQSTMILNTF